MNADTKAQKPFARLKKFFQSLFNCLARGARAVLQFYPETPGQVRSPHSTELSRTVWNGV